MFSHPRISLRSIARTLAIVSLLVPAVARAQADSVSAPSGEVAQAFRRLAPAVVRIEVRETGALALSAVGSGFFTAPSGRIITNYHVISRLVNEPERHIARATWGHDTLELHVLAVDVVHDLAVLEAPDAHPTVLLSATGAPMSKGDRIFALGHPRDLGLSIVEGTYNGMVEHVMTPRLHFTGPLNPGMSGGPAVTPAGMLVGVNVSTMGEELAFLVPAAEVTALLARTATTTTPPTSEELRADMSVQLAGLGTTSLDSLFVSGAPTVRLGPYLAPTEPSSAFQCWGDARDPKDATYRMVVHRCSTDESIFLSEDLSASLVFFSHQLLDGPTMGKLRLLTATEEAFNEKLNFDATAREATRFSCHTENVRTTSLTFRTELCARRLTSFDGLYEAVLRATPLGATAQTLVSTLTMSGMRFDLIRLLAARYLESITAAPEGTP